MCSMEKINIVSCQITYFPIDSKYYLDEINKVLELIKESGLQYNIGGYVYYNQRRSRKGIRVS